LLLANGAVYLRFTRVTPNEHLMKHLHITLALLLLGAAAFSTDTLAQSRELGARRIILDNGSGFELTLQPPAVMTTSGTFTFPDPATTSGSFVGQAITGPLSVTSGGINFQVASISGTNDVVLINGRDQAFGDFPLIISTNNTGLTYGATTYGRHMRYDQNGVGYRDFGVDNSGNYFVTGLNSTTHSLDLSSGGNLTITGNLITPGTVDGIDVSAADAQNVKLTGNQTIAGDKTFSGKLIPSGQLVMGNGSVMITTDGNAIGAPTPTLAINSNDAVPANRTFTLPNGVQEGQVIILRQQSNASQLQDAGNAMLTADMDFGPGDTITLIWDGTLNAWLEVARANN
jgi:hypothetical protein